VGGGGVVAAAAWDSLAAVEEAMDAACALSAEMLPDI
jgi:hypothetical protein